MILAIDPGETVGIAFLSDDGDLLLGESVSWRDFPNYLRSVKEGLDKPHKAVVVEALIKSPNTQALEGLVASYQVVKTFFPKAVEVPPGVWKNSRTAQMTKRPPRISRHSADAYIMGKYYVEKNR